MTKSKKELIIYLVVIICSALFLFIGNRVATGNFSMDGGSGNESYRASVLEIVSENGGVTTFTAKLSGGPRGGEVVTAMQPEDEYTRGQAKRVEKGDKVLIFQDAGSGNGQDWMFLEYIRTDALIALGIIFAALIVLYGRKKGFNALLSLTFTCLAVFGVFIPAILSGHNIYLYSVVICAYTIAMTLLLVNGFDQKALAAAIGCLGGVMAAGILTVIMSGIMHLTGFTSEESVFLTYLDLPAPIDLRAVIFASIIIGAMGAVMDVSISIASSLWELKENMESPSFSVLASSGINIGRDIMGTMVNTLVLAYIGCSLSLVLILSAYNHSLAELMNREMIVVEILQAIIGSIGMLCALPLTSVVGAAMYSRQ